MELTIALVSEMARLAGISNAHGLCRENLRSGKAMEYFAGMVEAQGGDLAAFEALPRARFILELRAGRTGYWCGPDALAVGNAVRALGGGRYRVEDHIDHLVGWRQEVPCGAPVENGQILGTVHGKSEEACGRAAETISESFTWDRPSDPLVLKEVHPCG